jgi:ADP-heptose:LPS heptosyltransferase
LGGSAVNFAGQTTLPEWAALLSFCDGVVCNDSGGMHLASALGVPLAAVFGITDPVRTGPLGDRCRVLQKSAVQSRAVARNSKLARERLAAVTPDEVWQALSRDADTKEGPAE